MIYKNVRIIFFFIVKWNRTNIIFVINHEFKNVLISLIAFDKTRWEKTRFSRPLLRTLIPTVVSFFMHVDDIVYLKFQFVFAVRRIWSYTPESFPYSLDSGLRFVAGVQGTWLPVAMYIWTRAGTPNRIFTRSGKVRLK